MLRKFKFFSGSFIAPFFSSKDDSCNTDEYCLDIQPIAGNVSLTQGKLNTWYLILLCAWKVDKWLRKAAKKFPPIVVRPLRGEGVKAGPLRKRNFFEALKTETKALLGGPLVEELFLRLPCGIHNFPLHKMRVHEKFHMTTYIVRIWRFNFEPQVQSFGRFNARKMLTTGAKSVHL